MGENIWGWGGQLGTQKDVPINNKKKKIAIKKRDLNKTLKRYIHAAKI